MAEDTTSQQMEPTGDVTTPLPPLGAKRGLLSTRGGRIAVVVGAVVAFLVVAGVVSFLAYGFLTDAVDEVVVEEPSDQVPTTGNQTSTAAPVASAEPTPPAAIDLGEIFTFRNIFEPLISEQTSATGTSGTTPTGGTSGSPGATSTAASSSTANTLYLQDIVVEDGESIAVMRYNATEYRLAEGEGISGTPWEVLRIGTGSVVMLYGDSQISLSIGQGLTK